MLEKGIPLLNAKSSYKIDLFILLVTLNAFGLIALYFEYLREN
jgi:hypothetical protein